MNPLLTLRERYPGKEFLPVTIDMSPESRPCKACGGKTSMYVVQNDQPQTFESGKFLHVQRKVIFLCLVCEADDGIAEVSQCLGREAP